MIQENLDWLERRISLACERSGRNREDVELLPVSKTFPVADIRQVAAFGYSVFGESRSQEGLAKATELSSLGLRWVMIGHLQRNKAREIGDWADEFQALDSLRLARALNGRLESAGRQMDVLVQINSSGEASKFGFSPLEVLPFVKELESCPALNPIGFMTLAANSADRSVVSACFEVVVDVQRQVQDLTGRAWPMLSMGMSNDFELAIEKGSTCVRIGSAIFGRRSSGLLPERQAE